MGVTQLTAEDHLRSAGPREWPRHLRAPLYDPQVDCRVQTEKHLVCTCGGAGTDEEDMLLVRGSHKLSLCDDTGHRGLVKL